MGELENLVLLYDEKRDVEEVAKAIKTVSSVADLIEEDKISEDEVSSIIEQETDLKSNDHPSYQISLGYSTEQKPAYEKFEYESQKDLTTKDNSAAYDVQTQAVQEIIEEGSEIGYKAASARQWGDSFNLDDKQKEQVAMAKMSMSQIEWFMVCEGILVKGAYK